VLAIVVLAAGQGTRMKSPLPKVLHEAAGKPLLEHVLLAVAPLEPEHTVVVVGHKADEVRARFAGVAAAAGVTWAVQREQLGTGHALLQTREVLEPTLGGGGVVLVVNGDGPLLRTQTLRALVQKQREGDAGMTLLTCEVGEPTGMGRILRAADGSVQRIVEEKDATPEERSLREINPGIYAFDAHVFEVAGGLNNDNAAGEFYITDLVDLYRRAGHRVEAVRGADETEVLGVNDPQQLALVDRLLRERGNHA
jgi:bifunctional UDP-N-acetylglucosamine pyrophosphorylase / glucosamine-1-phosphate N-acetyltransferase